MSTRVSASRKLCELLSTSAFIVTISILFALSARPAAAQSRVIQKWLATVKNPAQVQQVSPGSVLHLVNDATANSSGGVTVAGDLCVAVDSSGICSNLEFVVESYNSSGQKLWGSFIGSAGKQAEATNIISDSAGDVYAAGWEQNSVVQNGAATQSLILVKYAASGTREWIRYYGYYQESYIDQFYPAAIAVDAQDDVYITGAYSTNACCDNTTVTLKFSPSGAFLWADSNAPSPTIQSPTAITLDNLGDAYVDFNGGQATGFTIKYGPSGNVLWDRDNGDGASPDSTHSVALDSSSNIYEEGSYVDVTNSLSYAYAMKFDPAGDLLWSTQVENCTGYRSLGELIGVDGQGYSYLSSTNCSDQLVVTKLDSGGNILWQKTYTGTSTSVPVASYLNGEDDFYVLASVPSVNTNNSTNVDFLTLKYNGSGNLLWTTRFSGTSNTSSSEPVAMAASGGNLFVTGSTGGSATIPNEWATIDYVQDAADAIPTSLTFSSQVIDTTSAAQNVTLKNTSTQDLDIRGIDMSGPFSETNNCSSVIVAGGSCTIMVKFTPTSTGTQTGSLSIYDQWAGSPDAVTLTGTGAQ